MALKTALAFHQDRESSWVVELSCGHQQHVRHRPPFESRPWVTSAAGRRSKLGAGFDCVFCDMPELPPGLGVYGRTPVFDVSNVPRALLAHHRTKAGTWGRILVVEGVLSYRLEQPEPRVWLLSAGVVGIILPGQPHAVTLSDSTRFYLEFLRRA